MSSIYRVRFVKPGDSDPGTVVPQEAVEVRDTPIAGVEKTADGADVRLETQCSNPRTRANLPGAESVNCAWTERFLMEQVVSDRHVGRCDVDVIEALKVQPK